MGKRDELIARYADDLRTKCGVEPDMELLRKVTIGCGPSIYNTDDSTVSATDPKEMKTVKKNFLQKKLQLSDTDDLNTALDTIMDRYGRSNPRKYRAVVYYLLTKHFAREFIYA